MGKALRSNRKKAVKRSRREILEHKSITLRDAENKKQSILLHILKQPRQCIDGNCKNECFGSNEKNISDNSRCISQEDRVKAEEQGNQSQKRLINVTQMNAQSRLRKRSKFLHRNPYLHSFIVTNCERKKLSKKRQGTDSTMKIKSSLDVNRKATPQNEKTVVMHDVQKAKKRHLPYYPNRILAPGSQWLKFKKLTGSRKIGKKPSKGRYKHLLKGITQYYPVKKDEIMTDVNDQI